VATLRLCDHVPGADRHAGEIYGCAFAPDGAAVLTGGWDGWLRLWDASGACLAELQAAPKPLSCCAFSPDGSRWLSGSMEGVLGFWTALGREPCGSFLAHTRPISVLRYAPDGQTLATASWDRLVVLRPVGKEGEGRGLSGHQDIVAGCRFTADGRKLLSWSYDGTARLWDLATGRTTATLAGHQDRVTAADLSPDGRWAATGGRDGQVKLWDLATAAEVGSVPVGREVRFCAFLLDGESLVLVDAEGSCLLLKVPALEPADQVDSGRKVLCAALAPSGGLLALGCEDGQPAFVEVAGLERAPLVVTAMPTLRPPAGLLARLLGKRQATRVLSYTCPSCRVAGELATPPAKPLPCPACRRLLRVHAADAPVPVR
jgi:WD40 repeat protein